MCNKMMASDELVSNPVMYIIDEIFVEVIEYTKKLALLGAKVPHRTGQQN